MATAWVPTSIRCLLVDDHPAVRVGLRELLAAGPGFEVLDAVASAEAAVAFAERASVDVAVVGSTLQLAHHELEARLWSTLRKLERLDPVH